MIDKSISSCSNDNCSKKDMCLRYTNRRNVLYGQTYLSITEEQCEEKGCYINIDEYNQKMILDIINTEPNDSLDRKLLLDSCYKLLPLAEKYELNDKLLDKIKLLEQ